MVGENGTHWALLEIAEQAAPGNTINLWPRISVQVAGKSRKKVRPNTHRNRLQLVIGLGVLLVLIGSLIFVPAVQSAAVTIIKRFGINFFDTQLFGSNAEVGSPNREVIVITPSPTLTIREFQERLTFSLLTPTRLPEGLTYIDRDIQNIQSGQMVDIKYCRTKNMAYQSGCLVLHASYKAQPAYALLAESKEQTVEVNGQPGIYVHGGWQDNGKGDPNTRLGNLLWDDQVDDAYLTWMQDGVTYLLEAHKLGLGLEDMQRIAASMKGN